MKEKFYGLPAPLQKQIAIRVAGALSLLLLFVNILLGFWISISAFPALLSGFLLINGIRLCYNSFAGNYMCIQESAKN